MKKLLLFLAVVFYFGQINAQSNAWKQVSGEAASQKEKIRTTSYSEKQLLFQVDLNLLRQSLAGVTGRFSGQPGVIVSFPNISGNIEKFQVWENSNFAPELQAQYPDIRAYEGKSLLDGATINFSVSPAGVQTMVLRADNGSEFIEPYTNDQTVYVLFDSETRATGRLPFNCSTSDRALNEDLHNQTGITNRSNNQSYKTMRLALSCVGEYATFFGGTVAGALGGMNATMTRVNGVLEKDLALHLNLIANNNLVVYTNAGTDPYSSAGAGSGGAWNGEVQATLTSVIGDANYDIGHLLGASGGGGNAGCIGCVCNSGKGSAFTSPSDNIPQGDNFDIDYVIHEMGHQLGANHTFSHQTEGSGVNIEPGSGSTIMGYAGITSYDVQAHSDAYFTYRSILQIQNNLASKTCPVSTPLVNTPPAVAAGDDVTIPLGTPFVLRGIVSDAEGDVLTYCWEQNNSATSASDGADSVASPTKTSGPNFRSFTPNSTPNRYMPAYASVLTGVLSTMWESINTNGRTSKYTLTVRDNNTAGQQTNTDEITVVTSPSIGPFIITSPSTSTVSWAQGAVQTVTWDVNGSDAIAGGANVNIKLSVDGGTTFPYTLATNLPNDGSESITVPSIPASQTCRVMIEPTANIFYTVSPANFLIGYQVVTSCVTYNYTGAAFAVPDNNTSYTVKTINVPTAGTISDVNITVNATHPNLQNLNFAVIRPSGPLTTLFNQQCAGSANLDVVFDSQAGTFTCGSPTQGTYAPPTTPTILNTLNGFNPLGNWQFGFRDLVAGNTGTINSIALEVCSQTIVPLGTEEFGFESFALYPNPNNGKFTVQFNSASNSKINIAVHDISGRVIFDKAYTNSGLFSQELQLDNAQTGVYLVSISDGDKKVVKRIVIE